MKLSDRYRQNYCDLYPETTPSKIGIAGKVVRFLGAAFVVALLSMWTGYRIAA